MQPNTQSQQRALQVDIQQVIKVEAGMYTRMIADLTRQISVLSVALEDQESENRELHAKLSALTGGPIPGMGAPFTGSAMSRPGARITASANTVAEAPSAG